MKGHRSLLLGLVLLAGGVAGLVSLSGGGGFTSGIMGAAVPPGVEPEDLPEAASPGARILAGYCQQCHALPSPAMHTAEAWPPIVARMVQRMQAMAGGGFMSAMHGVRVPTDTEFDELLRYLRRYAQKPIDRASYADLATPAGQLFEKTCSQCHALPDPGRYTAAQWPAVLQRMVRNMTVMGKPVPDEQARETILAYLQQHAK